MVPQPKRATASGWQECWTTVMDAGKVLVTLLVAMVRVPVD